MPAKKVITLSDFTKGLNTSRTPTLLLPGECSILQNQLMLNGAIKNRPPVTVWPVLDGGAVLLDQGVTGLQALAVSTGNYYLIGLHQTKLSKIILGGASSYLSNPDGITISTSNLPWRTCQYKNIGYAVRGGQTTFIRFNNASYWSVGIPAPTTNATIADGAAGAVEAGAYYGVYTFVDADGNESAPSPVSAILNAAGAKKVDWASVDVSTSSRVTARNLYRTLTNQIGEYFYVGQIANNTATTFTENTTITEMGDAAPVDNLVPPSVNWYDLDTAFERLWATDGSFVYGSAAENPDAWPAENVYAFNPDDGQQITGVRRLGNDLLVFKLGSVWGLSQSLGAFEFVPRLVDGKNGCVATNSICVADGLAFWFSGNAVFISDGKTPGVDVSTGRIEELAYISDSVKENAQAAVYSKYGWYVLSFPNPDAVSKAGAGYTLFVYDYKQRIWFTIIVNKGLVKPGPGGGLGLYNDWYTAQQTTFMTQFQDVYGNPKVFVGFCDNEDAGIPRASVFDLFSDTPEATSGDVGGVAGYFFAVQNGVVGENYILKKTIPSIVQFKGVDFGLPGYQHTLSRILLNCDNLHSGETVDISVYQDRKEPDTTTSAFRTRSALALTGVKTWKNFGFSSREKKATVSEIRLTRNSVYSANIRALQIEGEVWNWRPQEGL